MENAQETASAKQSIGERFVNRWKTSSKTTKEESRKRRSHHQFSRPDNVWCLVTIATRAHWIERGEDVPVNNVYTDLLLEWPLPSCMHSMLRNIDQVIADWKELRLDKKRAHTKEGCLKQPGHYLVQRG